MADYLGIDSKFFRMFRPFMRPISQFHRFQGFTFARETFVYMMNDDEWSGNLEKLGLVRLPEERRPWKAPWSAEELLSFEKDSSS